MLHNTAAIYEFIEAEIGTRVVSHGRYDTFQMAELVGAAARATWLPTGLVAIESYCADASPGRKIAPNRPGMGNAV